MCGSEDEVDGGEAAAASASEEEAGEGSDGDADDESGREGATVLAEALGNESGATAFSDAFVDFFPFFFFLPFFPFLHCSEEEPETANATSAVLSDPFFSSVFSTSLDGTGS